MAVNARDAMPNGGAFTLSVSDVTSDHVLPVALNGSLVAIECRDTGTGIPPNLLSKIFDPFFTTKEVGKGTGLGLSQVYGFAHQAGGTIKAESTVGQGTTLTIYRPCCFEEKTSGMEVPVQEDVGQKRPAVLIVDDSPEVAEVTSSLFEYLGYHPIYRESGESALNLLADGTKVDLVFTDIVKPGTIDGVGLAIEIRAR
ncbi:MAG: ATP-binding protein, partial [Gammaproteobacteria bacterium]